MPLVSDRRRGWGMKHPLLALAVGLVLASAGGCKYVTEEVTQVIYVYPDAGEADAGGGGATSTSSSSTSSASGGGGAGDAGPDDAGCPALECYATDPVTCERVALDWLPCDGGTCHGGTCEPGGCAVSGNACVDKSLDGAGWVEWSCTPFDRPAPSSWCVPGVPAGDAHGLWCCPPSVGQE